MQSLECKHPVHSSRQEILIIIIYSIYTCHDDAKDKDFELELSWICAESKYKHQFVPNDIKEEAERLAKVR